MDRGDNDHLQESCELRSKGYVVCVYASTAAFTKKPESRKPKRSEMRWRVRRRIQRAKEGREREFKERAKGAFSTAQANFRGMHAQAQCVVIRNISFVLISSFVRSSSSCCFLFITTLTFCLQHLELKQQSLNKVYSTLLIYLQSTHTMSHLKYPVPSTLYDASRFRQRTCTIW